MGKDTRMSIVVVSCDAYKDIVEYYLKFLSHNWPDCIFRILIATEEYEHKSNIATTVKCGKGTTWTKRAIDAINQTNSEYILLSVDDLFMSKPVNGIEIDKVLDFIEADKIKYYRFPTFKIAGQNSLAYQGNENVELIPRDRTYGVSIGTAIWERKEILDILGDGTKSAWDLENDFSEKAAGQTTGFIDKYVSDKRFLLNSVHMIKAGKWIPQAAKTMTNYGYPIDYEIRGYLTKRECLRSIVYGLGTCICPRRFRKPLKRFFSKLGFKFATKN